MNFKEYQDQATRTCPSLGNIKIDLCHMVLGLLTEADELKQAINKKDNIGISEEIADIYWYMSNYCSLRMIHLHKLEPLFKTMGIEDINDLFIVIADLQDIIKKYIAYNRPINTINELNCLNSIHRIIAIIIYDNNLDIYQALENNINKLKIRYPDKFNEKDALNRDTDKEYSILGTNILSTGGITDTSFIQPE